MKKKILSLALALCLILALIPATFAAEVGIPGTYDPGDIAAINAIIANNGLKWTPAPADGSSVPDDWDVVFTEYGDHWRIAQLWIANEGLTGKLDVSGLTALELLVCWRNQLTALDISNNSALKELSAADNLLTSLDVSNNPALRSLDFGYNHLTMLDISNNPALTELICHLNYFSNKATIVGLDESKTTVHFDPQNQGSPPAPPPLFSDIETITGERLEMLEFVVGRGLFQGSGGRFNPFDRITNMQFITVMSRMANPGIADGNPWYQPHLDWAAGIGISGFDRDALLTRDNMALWFYNYITASGIEPVIVNADTPSFNDIGSLPAEVQDAILSMYEWGITRGTTPGVVYGLGNAERIDIAVIIGRFVSRNMP